MPNLWIIFLTGLFAGGLTCMVVQGGLFTSALAQEQIVERNMRRRHRAVPILMFLGAKLIAYTLAGVLLGFFGSLFYLSLHAQIILQVAVALFLAGTALSLLNVHPLFRYFIITPPRFLMRIVRRQSKSSVYFAPFFLGACTVFIPCGTTQAMMALAIGSGNPLYGGAILFSFTLGTSVLFCALGVSIEKLRTFLGNRFEKAVATVLLLTAAWNVNTALALSGSTMNLGDAWRSFYCTVSFCDTPQVLAGTTSTQEATITIESRGYSVDNPTLKAGAPIKLTLVNKNGAGCTQVFTIPKLGIQKIVPLGQTSQVQFLAPKEPGALAFMCGMGMYGGSFRVAT